MDKYVVVDLETTGNITHSDQIIEVGIVVIEDNEITDEFSTLLQPGKSIPPFVSNLTGITDQDVAFAPKFAEIAPDIVDIFKESYLIAHNVPFDLGFLNSELESVELQRLTNPVIDTVELTRIMYPQAPGYKLSQLAEYLHIKHKDPHRALSDAYVTAKLFLKLLEKLKSLPAKTIAHLLRLEKGLKSDLYHLLHDQQERLEKSISNERRYASYRGVAYKSQVEEQSSNHVPGLKFGEFLDRIYEENGTMSRGIVNYEERTGQREMSEYIYDAFRMNNHALIEAETGTGKTVAYLLPAVYEAVNHNRRIVVSTYTTQLQSQILEEEIPLVEKLIPFSINVALIKGKNHYLDLEKFAKELDVSQSDNYDITLTKAMILVWLTETDTGDIDELLLPSSGYLFYQKVATDSESDQRSESRKENSFYYQARRRAEEADLVITNHALLCTDIFSGENILPEYDRIIVDEAHHLEDSASRFYGMKLDYVTFQHTLNHIGSTNSAKAFDVILEEENAPRNSWIENLSKTKYEVDELFRTLYQFVWKEHHNRFARSDTGRIQFPLVRENLQGEQWKVIIEMAKRVIFFLGELNHLLVMVKNKRTVADVEIRNSIDKVNDLKEKLNHLFVNDNKDTFVNWIEIEAFGAKNAVYLYSEPRDISNTMTELFFQKKNSVILTSATLTMKNSFSFIQKRLGVPNEVVKKRIQSPFSYQNQVRLMVPNDFPNIKSGNIDGFLYATCETILSLAEITSGRMMILFTSYDMLKRAHELIKEMREMDNYILIAQGITSGSRTRLKKNFQSFEKAILLGTSSFWEGVDIPGDDLSCLVIVRLPFQPPNHPIFEAKSTYLRAQNRNPFYELALPNAVLRFKQGFGRLIRSSTDRGIVFVCDARLINSSYGKYFTDSIPNVPISFNSTAALMDQARDWF
ncbi:ATP-dependent DNA helicase DinG [Oceanobacillus limi]|uniref:3'-5' exonuclease DinG n=1 Tax=Oceanobacillus limi TaxID=930131 RepID=A0A1H9ZET0_9BACI|nr:ATP-dependent DNA helicase DinG [Oceanobacillus limi]SES80090.1 ATP-dependent DNA helicase DinG [Oceanobacillus limi]